MVNVNNRRKCAQERLGEGGVDIWNAAQFFCKAKTTLKMDFIFFK